MEIGETLYVTDRIDFRKWLEENHNSRKEIWLIQYKKAAKKLRRAKRLRFTVRITETGGRRTTRRVRVRPRG